MNFDLYYKIKQTQINEAIKKLFLKEQIPKELLESMQYSLLAGGKRIRPVISLMVDDAMRNSFKDDNHSDIINIALALECIHTYSLIHDDLPSMDNDDLRRGKPTCHIKYGEAMAILAGDGLLTYAFDLLSRMKAPVHLEAYQSTVSIVSKMAGVIGMVGGQVIDMQSEKQTVSMDVMKKIHNMKTGALIHAAVTAPLYYRDNKENLSIMEEYAKYIGIGFQIVDDILDVTSSNEVLGKTANSDIINEKSTYVTLMGLNNARVEAKNIIDQSKKVVEKSSLNTQYLLSLSDYILNRIN